MFSKKKSKIFEYPTVLKDIQRILIILPYNAKIDDFNFIESSDFSQQLLLMKFVFLLKGNGDQNSGELNIDKITVTKTDFNPFHRPKNRLLKSIRDMEFDVSVDLNSKMHLPFAFIPYKCEIPIRISFSREGTDLYNNLKLIVKEDLTIEEKIRFLFSFLNEFRKSSKN
ncbi:hypothetical protein JXI42_05715 [bacterium]|nr:hypothetical protein [bacterium]